MIAFDYKFYEENGYVLIKDAIPSLRDAQLEIESIVTKAKS